MHLFGSDLQTLIVNIGLLGAWLILFAESGLLIGFFLPGDSLIFTAGLIASLGHFSLLGFMIGGTIAAILGAEVGYIMGRKFGPRIFVRDNSLLFDKKHIERAKAFYANKGAMTIILARFVPVVRTFVPILAGVGGMDRRQFVLYNVIGAVLWVPAISILGFYLGRAIPSIDNYILPIIALIVVFSVAPAILTLKRSKS